ncbi:TIGR03915 family putative DNA repair protein [Clostridium sp. BJN0001]|uniref:TIGR03915 family putative DNA repair protein n=1 Tax=Clostridium sp. BJN0001 TaxID=2930219 RepID=UPI001FD5C83E|nr:TIGR03915 family putative DNA repair protein [Clostridium sp. BJN0001]
MYYFLYDDTFEGLITCIYDSFYSKEKPSSIISVKDDYAPLLLGECREIKTDLKKFSKVKKAILNKINFLVFKQVYLIFLSCYKEKGLLIYDYLKLAFKVGPDITCYLHNKTVHLIYDTVKKVTYESHKFEGFVRFSYIDNKFLYSSIEPDNDILELLSSHFESRFSNEYFIIHDIKREKALIYNKKNSEIVEMEKSFYKSLNTYYDEFKKLWVLYFKSTTITERANLRLQLRMMPRRYWKHICESQYN